MEQKLISLLRVLAASESQIDASRAILIKSSKEALKLVDTTGRNILSSFEVSQFLEKHKIKLEQDEVRMIVQYYDITRKGKLDLDSFQKALTPRNRELTPSSSKSLEENLLDFFVKELDLIRKTQTLRVQLFEAAQAAKTDVFKLIDTENNGEITVEDLEKFLQSKGARLSSGEVKALFQRGDRNGKDLITQQDFEAFIAPDVTKKKVIAKQPDLNIQTETEIRKPAYSQSAKNATQDPIPHHYGGAPGTTINRGYPHDNYSYESRPVQHPVASGQATINQLMEKYGSPAPAHSTYQPYTPSYQAPVRSYSPQATDRLDYNAPRSYSPSHYTHYESKTYEGSYYPGKFANQPSSSLHDTYPNPSTSQYPDSRSYSFYHKDPNHYPTTTYHDTTASRYGATTSYEHERGRNMNRSLSISALHSPVSKSSTYDRGFGDYTSTSYGYREPLSTSHYQGTYERSRYEHSPYRSRDYGDYRPASSLSPTRYDGPSRDYTSIYQGQYEANSYPRREEKSRSLYSSVYVPTGYESRGYKGYDTPGYGTYGSDSMRRSGIAPQNQALRDWGNTSGYGPSQVSSTGSRLYDRNQLQDKYNSLSRNINIYA